MPARLLLWVGACEVEVNKKLLVREVVQVGTVISHHIARTRNVESEMLTER